MNRNKYSSRDREERREHKREFELDELADEVVDVRVQLRKKLEEVMELADLYIEAQEELEKAEAEYVDDN